MKDVGEFKAYLAEQKEKGRMFGDYLDPIEITPEDRHKLRIKQAQQCMSLGMTYEEVYRLYYVTQEELLS